VGTLQNVAVISSWQIMPVLGSGELFVVPLPLSACCRDCAATGDVAKSSAVINASFFMCALVLGLITDQTITHPGRYRTREHVPS
jgi:hypothetical protein